MQNAITFIRLPLHCRLVQATTANRDDHLRQGRETIERAPAVAAEMPEERLGGVRLCVAVDFGFAGRKFKLLSSVGQDMR